MEQKQEQKQELKKNLGAVTAMATVVGSVIGSGVFFKPQAIYTATGGAPGLGLYAWLITGIVSIAAALRSCDHESENRWNRSLSGRNL